MDEKQIKVAIDETLKQLGMPHHLKGYRYVFIAIEKCVADRRKLEKITKSLYPEIASENSDTVSRTERAMRHAIEVAWVRGNTNTISRLFGYTVSYEKGRPTNTEFIAYLCDFIMLHGEEIANGTYLF